MAALYSRGELKLNEVFHSQSLNGSVFKGRLRSEVRVGNRWGVIPEVSGRAWVTGFTQVVLNPLDPLGTGFLAAEY